MELISFHFFGMKFQTEIIESVMAAKHEWSEAKMQSILAPSNSYRFFQLPERKLHGKQSTELIETIVVQQAWLTI